MKTLRVLPIIAALLCTASLSIAAAAQSDALAEARRLFDAARYDDVLRQLNGVTAQPSDNAQINYLLGLAFHRKQDYVRAAPFLQKVIQQTSDATREHREAVQVLGMARYLLGHLAEAVPLLEKAAAWWPSNNEYIYALGMACIQARQPDKARAAFARMYRVAPDSAAAHLLTAQMMIRVEVEEFAEAELRQALAKEPKLPQANYLLAQNAIYKSRLDEGIALLERELAINPGNANAYYKLGDAYTRQLKWDEAISVLQKSVWLNPFYSGPYILLGKSYLKKRELPNAEMMLKRAIQFDPNNKSAHYLLAQVYQQSGRAEDAKREFALAEKLQGGNDTPEK